MKLAVYIDVSAGVARYHRMGEPHVESGRTTDGWWEIDLDDREATFRRSLRVPRIKAVVPCDECFPFSTEAQCVGCM